MARGEYGAREFRRPLERGWGYPAYGYGYGYYPGYYQPYYAPYYPGWRWVPGYGGVPGRWARV